MFGFKDRNALYTFASKLFSHICEDKLYCTDQIGSLTIDIIIFKLIKRSVLALSCND